MAKTFKIKFSVQGYVEQDVTIDDPDMTAEKLQTMLRNGNALTSIQEDGTIDLISGTEIGTVDSVDNQCEYTDFEVDEA